MTSIAASQLAWVHSKQKQQSEKQYSIPNRNLEFTASRLDNTTLFTKVLSLTTVARQLNTPLTHQMATMLAFKLGLLAAYFQTGKAYKSTFAITRRRHVPSRLPSCLHKAMYSSSVLGCACLVPLEHALPHRSWRWQGGPTLAQRAVICRS